MMEEAGNRLSAIFDRNGGFLDHLAMTLMGLEVAFFIPWAYIAKLARKED
jgi:hypothetical protein